MPIESYDIATLFQSAFGVQRGKPFDTPEPTRVRQEPPYDELPNGAGYDDEGTEFVSMRDTLKVYDSLGRQVFLPVRIGGVLLPNEPTLLIAGKKHIIETPLVGSTRRGTVKELISVGDYDIQIRGIAANSNSKTAYPEDIVKKLNDLYLRNEAVDIECAMTSLLGIYRVVIKDLTLPEMLGVQHAQAYQFTCVSDEDFILEL